MAFVELGTWRFLVVNNVGQAGVLENTGRCVSHVQEYSVEFAMVYILRHKISQSIRIPKRGERSVHHTNDLAKSNLGWTTPQPPPARTAARALYDPGMLQFEQDQREKFYRQVTLRSYVPNFDWSLLVSPRERH